MFDHQLWILLQEVDYQAEAQKPSSPFRKPARKPENGI